jgi:hypothetical protein
MDPTKRPNAVDLKDLSSLTDKILPLSALGGKLEDDWLEIDDLSSYVMSFYVFRFPLTLQSRQLPQIPVGDVALAKASLSKLNESKGAMQTLNSAPIATATTTLHTTILRRELSSLPLEILSLIRVWLHVMDSNDTFAYSTPEDPYYPRRMMVPNKSFPLVCRRFREVELTIPELWTTVNTKMSYERVKLHIARSGDLPLRVQIRSDIWYHEERARSRHDDVSGLIASHAQRCEWMEIYSERRGNSDLRSDMIAFLSTIDGIHLSKLRRLDIVVPGAATLSSLRTWSMPQLSELFCASPGALLALPILHNLDVLKLTFDYERSYNADDLIDLLSSPTGSNLQTLELRTLKNRYGEPPGHPDTQSTSGAVLPMLKSFRLHQHSDRNIHSLLQRIQAPSIETIAVEIDCRDHRQVDYAVEPVVEWISSQRNPNLRNVNIKLRLLQYNYDRMYRGAVHLKVVNFIEATLSGLPVVSIRTWDRGWRKSVWRL